MSGFTGFFLFPLLYIANEFHQMPHNVLRWLSSPITEHGFFARRFDAGALVFIVPGIFLLIRWLRQSRYAERIGKRKLAMTPWLYAIPVFFLVSQISHIPHHARDILPWLSMPLHIPVAPILGISRALLDLAFIIFMGVAITLFRRWRRNSQLAARIVKRTFAIGSRTIHYYGQSFWRFLLAQSRPKAGAFVDAAHTSGESNSDYLQDIVPSLNRGDLAVIIQTDDRFAFEEPEIISNKNDGAQTRVNRSIRYGDTILMINGWLEQLTGVIEKWTGKRFKWRIEFGHPRVITFLRGEGTHHPNVEDDYIVLGTYYFPLPRPIVTFFDGLQREEGVRLTIDQKATFFAARRRFGASTLIYR